MAKSKRRFTSGTGPDRPESPRRAYRPAPTSPPPARRPPAGSTRPVGTPRPIVPERQHTRSGWLGALGAQRVVVAVSALAVLAALGLLLFAWWDQNVRPRRELAVEVGNRSYDREYWARRFKMAYDDPANASDVRNGFATALVDKTTDAIVREAILLQRADALGVSAGQNEIDKEMLVRNGVGVVAETPEGQEPGPDDSFQITPGMGSAVRARLRDFGLTIAQYRELTQAALLRQKADAHFLEQVPARAPQVKVRVLQFPNESDSRIAIDKIKNGEARFDELAETVSLDRLGKGRGGLRDWQPRGIMPKPLDDAAFSLPLNTLSEPIDSGLANGWFLIEVVERTDERDISEDARKTIAQNALNDWLGQQKEQLGAKIQVGVEDAAWADSFLGIRAAAAATGTAPPAGLPNLPVQPQTAPAAPGGTLPIAPAAPPPPPASSP